MEEDYETKGEGNSYTTEFRQYDPRIGRWLTVDPLAQQAAGWTPYRAFFDNPMIYTDNDGLFETRKEARQYKREHKGEIAGNSKIVKNGEGGFDLRDRENNITYTRSKDNFEGSVENFKNDGVMESALALGEKVSKPNNEKGVTAYVETDGIGHVYFEVKGVVFSYGRYNGSYSPSSGAYGPVGPGVLMRESHKYAVERMKKSPTEVYKFPNADADKVYKYINDIYHSGAPSKSGGREIDTYLLFGNNCTSTTVGALRVGGVDIKPTLQVPSSFSDYMKDPSFYNYNNNWLYK
jgi:RHS repeat-associated protein